MNGQPLVMTGHKQTDRLLASVPFLVQGRVLRTALSQAMEPVKEEAQREFPKRTGRTAKRLRIRTTKPSPDGTRKALLGIKGKATGGKGRNFPTGRAAEFGSEHNQALYVLRRCLRSKHDEAINRLRDIIIRETPRVIAEYHAKRK